jgi:hypothetical protein
LPAAVHTAAPELQTTVFFRHESAEVQSAPAVQLPHAPLLQTSLVPQPVPFATLVPVSVQTETPDPHDVTPPWHEFVGAHAVPAVHAVHAPLSQTLLVPQEAPFAALLPVSVQTGVPVVHDVWPA